MTDISRTQAWLESLRPKTLPLAFAAIIVGTALAWQQGHFDPWVALLALITAGLLQIFPTSPTTMATRLKAAINPTVSGRCADAERGDYPGADETRADRHRGADLSLWSGAAVLRLADHGDFIGFLVLGGCRSSPPSPTPSAPALMAISALAISRCWFSSAG
jgi:1,4-dihydroxy-2-naphthoate octaprenyltransferase